MHLRHVHDTRELSGLKNPSSMPLGPGWNSRCAEILDFYNRQEITSPLTTYELLCQMLFLYPMQV